MYNLATTQKWNYEDLVTLKPCTHPSHDFPSMLYVAPGDIAVHTCPACGLESKVVGREYFMTYGL